MNRAHVFNSLAHRSLLSAKGAVSYQPGATPQENAKPQDSGLKARPIVPMNDRIRGGINRAFSAPDFKRRASWGVAPGWNSDAPLALNASARPRAHSATLRVVRRPYSSGNSEESRARGCKKGLSSAVNPPTNEPRLGEMLCASCRALGICPRRFFRRFVYFCYLDESRTPQLGAQTSHFILPGIAIPAAATAKTEQLDLF